jgi:aspartate aminotransferase
MTGWRIGYTAGSQPVIKAMAKLQGQSTSCPNSIAQHAAIEALIGDQKIIQEMVSIFKKRRGLIIDGLNSINNIICEEPKGAFYVFPNISSFLNKKYKNISIKSSNDLSMLLLEKTFVVTVAGDCFGAPENIRFSYATSDDIITQMIDRIKPIFDSIK